MRLILLVLFVVWLSDAKSVLDDLEDAVDDVADFGRELAENTKDGLLSACAKASGCPEDTSLYHFECCSLVDHDCCIKIEQWAWIAGALIGILIAVCCVFACARMFLG